VFICISAEPREQPHRPGWILPGHAVIWGTDEYIHTYLPHWRVACEDHRQRLSRHADSSCIGVGITSLSPFQSASSYLALKRYDVAMPSRWQLGTWFLSWLTSLSLVVDLGQPTLLISWLRFSNSVVGAYSVLPDNKSESLLFSSLSPSPGCSFRLSFHVSSVHACGVGQSGMPGGQAQPWRNPVVCP
jgi:hypothetical protein